MYVHDEKKFCFLASPRTGSRAWRDALLQVGFRAIGAHHNGPREGFKVSGYTTFTLVRNHYDAILSWWYYTHGPQYDTAPSLEWLATEFTNNSYVKPGIFWQNVKHCAMVFRFENMARDYELFMEGALGIEDPPPLLVVGKSPKRRKNDFTNFFNAETRQFITWVWGDEMKRMGYDYVHP